jgi:hypothetical protein
MVKLTALFLIAFSAFAEAAPFDQSPEQLIQAVQTAERVGDVASLTRLVSPAFIQQHSSGTVERLSAYLADRSSASTNPSSGRSYVERDVQWRQVGDTAIRTSIARIRGAKPGIDIWVRSTAVVVREDGAWKLLNLDSALLHEGPPYDAPIAIPSPTRDLLTRGGQTYLELQGRETPLIPIRPDLFWAGDGSTLTLARDPSGAVVSMTRKYGERIAWTRHVSSDR